MSSAVPPVRVPPPAAPGHGATGQAPAAAKLSPLNILALSVIFFFAAALLCLALAFGWIRGYPDSALKSVAIFYQAGANPNGLSVYLHPPLNFLQTNGQGQLLAFQFTNRGGAVIQLRSLELFSADCFRIEPRAPATIPYPPLKLDPNQSVLLWYRLLPINDPRDCPGQSPLVFLYTWQQAPDQATPHPGSEQQSVSTGPVRIATVSSMHWERFFSLLSKIVPLILLPVLLAIANYLLQDLQSRRTEAQQTKDKARENEEKHREARRARRQKLQEQKLEVWKTMIPGMVQAIREHYVPLVRVLALIQSQAEKPAAQVDGREILACVLLLRAKFSHLVDRNGGFYFRNHRGEELCAHLANTLLDRCYLLSGDRQVFLETAETIEPTNSFTQVRKNLSIDAPAAGPFAQLCAFFQQQVSQATMLTQLHAHVVFLGKILEREINDPFYPFWYETAPEPLSAGELSTLIAQLGLTGKQAQEMSDQLTAYFASLPPSAAHVGP